MNVKILSAGLVAGLLVLSSAAAPDPVAEGFVDWEGITPKSCLFGRAITPSDLRQWTVVYVVVDDAAFTGAKVKELSPLARLMPVPSDHSVQWETDELPHNGIVVFSVRNAKSSDPKAFAARFRPPKDAEQDDSQAYASYKQNLVPFYKDLAPAGEAEMAADKLPFVAVYAAEGTDPVYTKEKFSGVDVKDVREAVKKAREKLPAEWTPPLGVSEPQFFKQVPPLLAKGKPASAALKILSAGIRSKNPDQAKEAQVMFDALNQYGTALKLRIGLEHHAAPARAYYDLQTLIRLFPSEKKKMQDIDQKFKQNKELGSLGKIFEKLMLWGRDDFAPKSAGDAKKIVAELQKIKKALEALANSPNAQVQGEAMLFTAQLDSLIETIPTKVPQK